MYDSEESSILMWTLGLILILSHILQAVASDCPHIEAGIYRASIEKKDPENVARFEVSDTGICYKEGYWKLGYTLCLTQNTSGLKLKVQAWPAPGVVHDISYLKQFQNPKCVIADDKKMFVIEDRFIYDPDKYHCDEDPEVPVCYHTKFPKKKDYLYGLLLISVYTEKSIERNYIYCFDESCNNRFPVTKKLGTYIKK